MSTETREARVARLLTMKKTLSVTEIAKVEDVSASRIRQLIGPTRTLNPILLRVHAFLCEYQRRHKFPASLTEIAQAFPTAQGRPRSTTVVAYWLTQMERLRMIEPRTPGARRNLFARKLPRTPEVLEMQNKIEG